MPLTAEDTLDRFTAKAARILNWRVVRANCYDGSHEAWVEDSGGQERMIGSTRIYSPIEELMRRFKKAQAEAMPVQPKKD